MRVIRSADVKASFAKRLRFQRRCNRAAQSVERRSRRAAAKFDQRFDRSARTKCSWEPKVFPFLKLGAHLSRHLEKRNAISQFCSGELKQARQIGSRRQNAASICSTSRARSNALFQICRFGRENSPISRSRSKFGPAIS